MKHTHVELSDSEWMSMLDRTRDGLPPCCANISALRDEVAEIAMNGGLVGSLRGGRFLQVFKAAVNGHDSIAEHPLLLRIVAAAKVDTGLTLAAVPHPIAAEDSDEHLEAMWM